jgi:hypothetical protein
VTALVASASGFSDALSSAFQAAWKTAANSTRGKTANGTKGSVAIPHPGWGDSFDPQRYHDEYQEALKTLINAKVEGAPLPAPPSERGEQIVDLMEALRGRVILARG